MLCSHLHLDLTVGGAFKNYRFTSCMNFSSHWCFVHVSVYNTLLEPVSFIIHIPRGRHTQQTWPDQTRSDQIRPDQNRSDQTRTDQTRSDQTRPSNGQKKHVQSTWIKPIQLKPVWCSFSLNMDVHWTAPLATVLWRWRRYTKCRLSFKPI